MAKRCTLCLETKEAADFRVRKSASDGLGSWCRPCIRAYNRKRQLLDYSARAEKMYGLTPEGYEQLLLEQGGLCAICRQPPVERRLAVDHCHRTGVVRGLLCHGCNLCLGRLNDDPALFRRAAEYLR